MLEQALGSPNQFFFDTEYLKVSKGGNVSLDFISIGIVPQYRGMPEFYAISTDFDPSIVPEGNFVEGIVMPRLELPPEDRARLWNKEIYMPHKSIGPAIAKYLGTYNEATMWAYKDSKDRDMMELLFDGTDPSVALEHIYGCKETLFADLETFIRWSGAKEIPERSEVFKHNGLWDARWHRDIFWHLKNNYLPKPSLTSAMEQARGQMALVTEQPSLQPEM